MSANDSFENVMLISWLIRPRLAEFHSPYPYLQFEVLAGPGSTVIVSGSTCIRQIMCVIWVPVSGDEAGYLPPTIGRKYFCD